MDDGLTFDEIELAVFTYSEPLRMSTAFRNALNFVEKSDYDKYKKLIELEYEEMYG